MICSKERCTGCFACYNICPKKAIQMEEDEFGNIYPTINKEKCIDCNLCKKVCPQLKEKVKMNKPVKAYALYNKNLKKRRESTSGGAATLLYEYVLSKGGVVYGASNLFGKSKFDFIRVVRIEDLYKLKGSKYVHCYINDTFKQVKNDLDGNKMVLFIGTPCQVSGLKSYLIKDYDLLYTADIVCHGVPNQKLLFDEINKIGILSKNINYIKFRDEKGYSLKIYGKNKKVLYEKPASEIEYYNNFLQGNIFRENCYSCRYAKRERVSDITLGDFWGLSKDSKVYDDELKGISLVIPTTLKGEKLFEAIKDFATYEERSIDEACKQNSQLNHPASKTSKYDIFIKNYPSKGYEKTMKMMCGPKDRIKRFIKKNRFIYNVLKKVKATISMK